ncbi:MAG: hypothetical protein QOI59_3614 [Gammaproteobacteria bacterium]|nr:hypothetical protein [Gammaproteobacteria bacterium]
MYLLVSTKLWGEASALICGEETAPVIRGSHGSRPALRDILPEIEEAQKDVGPSSERPHSRILHDYRDCICPFLAWFRDQGLFIRIAPVEQFVQVTPFGVNTNTISPANQTRYASPRLTCGRVDIKTRITMRLAVEVFGHYLPAPSSTTGCLA